MLQWCLISDEISWKCAITATTRSDRKWLAMPPKCHENGIFRGISSRKRAIAATMLLERHLCCFLSGVVATNRVRKGESEVQNIHNTCVTYAVFIWSFSTFSKLCLHCIFNELPQWNKEHLVPFGNFLRPHSLCQFYLCANILRTDLLQLHLCDFDEFLINWNPSRISPTKKRKNEPKLKQKARNQHFCQNVYENTWFDCIRWRSNEREIRRHKMQFTQLSPWINRKPFRMEKMIHILNDLITCGHHCFHRRKYSDSIFNNQFNSWQQILGGRMLAESNQIAVDAHWLVRCGSHPLSTRWTRIRC